ncbi:MAG TPA: hypothetical protein PLU22_11555 [Polyangiaceae bacterium]|nr:hypothetical protein [Polyangiaceae bacterium]
MESDTMGNQDEGRGALDRALDAMADSLGEVDTDVLLHALGLPLPDWWIPVGQPGHDATEARLLERLAAQDWRVCLELLAARGDPRALVLLAEEPGEDPEASTGPDLDERDQDLLWHLGSTEALAVIAERLGITSERLEELMTELRRRLGSWGERLLAERLGDHVDVAQWRADCGDRAPSSERSYRLNAAKGPAFDLPPTLPTKVAIDDAFHVEATERSTTLSFTHLVPRGGRPRVRWHFVFDPGEEAQYLRGLGLDRTLLGMARLSSQDERAYALLLDRLLHRAGEFDPTYGYRITVPGRQPSIKEFSIAVDRDDD